MGNCIQRASPAPLAEPPPPLDFAALPPDSTALVAAFLNPASRNNFRLVSHRTAHDGAVATREIVVRNRLDLQRALVVFSAG